MESGDTIEPIIKPSKGVFDRGRQKTALRAAAWHKLRSYYPYRIRTYGIYAIYEILEWGE